MGLHVPLEASSKIVWLLRRCCSAGGVRLSGNCFSAGGFLYTGVAAAPLEFAALHGAAHWRRPPQLCGCCSSEVRCFTGGCSLEFLHICVAAAPLESAALHEAAPLMTVVKQGNFMDFFSYELYSTLLHLPPLRFHCVEGCWDRTQDCCDFGIDSQTL